MLVWVVVVYVVPLFKIDFGVFGFRECGLYFIRGFEILWVCLVVCVVCVRVLIFGCFALNWWFVFVFFVGGCLLKCCVCVLFVICLFRFSFVFGINLFVYIVVFDLSFGFALRLLSFVWYCDWFCLQFNAFIGWSWVDCFVIMRLCFADFIRLCYSFDCFVLLLFNFAVFGWILGV